MRPTFPECGFYTTLGKSWHAQRTRDRCNHQSGRPGGGRLWSATPRKDCGGIPRSLIFNWEASPRREAMRRLLWKTSAAIIAVLNPPMMLCGAAAAEPTYIVAIGDSLTHGMGVSLDEAFPAQLEKILRADGFNFQVFNAGVDGDTTDRMLLRMNSVIPSGTKVVIVQGGYNDFMSLRGRTHSLSVEQSDANKAGIVTRVQAQGMQAILCGGPRDANLAREYSASWVSCYDPDLVRSHLIDGVHLDLTGHQIVAARLLPVIEGFLRKPPARRTHTSAAQQSIPTTA